MEIWYRGEAVGVSQAPGRTNPHDLGDGLYLTDRLDVATRYAEDRTTDPSARRVFSVPINLRNLKVLDLTKDPRWQKLLNTPLPGMGEAAIKSANENYGKYFQSFIKINKIKIEDYDALIGLEYVRGGRQMCILFKDGKPSPLQHDLRSSFRLIGGTPTPATPPAALRFRGRIGPGFRIVVQNLAGSLASFLLGFLQEWLWSKVWELEFKRQIEDHVEPLVRAEIGKRIVQVAEVQCTGRKAFANIVLEVTQYESDSQNPNRDDRTSIPFVFLSEIKISDRNINEQGNRTLERRNFDWVIRMPYTYSLEVSLSNEEVELYRAFKLELKWYEDQLQHPKADQDAIRLSQEKARLEKRLRDALGQ